MANTATVTGKVGPGLTMTAQVFDDVKGIEFDFEHSMIRISHGILLSQVAYSGVTTVTFSINGTTTEVTIS